MPTVSVIMPVHNGAEYVREAIESILGQSFSDFEFIVVDDGSTDASLSIINEFKDSRIKAHCLATNAGICRALNTGLSLVRGEFVARMDADDISTKDRLACQVDFMRRHPDVGLCGSDVVRFSDKNGDRIIQRTPKGTKRIRAYALFDNPFIHSTVLFRRSVIDRFKVKYDESYVNAEDYDLWTRLTDLVSCENLDQVLLEYRVHRQSVTSRASGDMNWKGCAIAQRQLFKLGIAADDAQVAFHRQIGVGQAVMLQDDGLGRAAKWLEFILRQNRGIRCYDEHSLKSVLAFVWYRFNYNCMKAGWGSHRNYYSFTGKIMSFSALWYSMLYTLAIIKDGVYARRG